MMDVSLSLAEWGRVMNGLVQLGRGYAERGETEPEWLMPAIEAVQAARRQIVETGGE